MIFKRIIKSQHSLKSRLLVHVLVMLLPAAALMMIAYSNIRDNINEFGNIIDAPLEQLLIAKKIQNNILKTELPFQLFLSRGETADRETFLRLSIEIDLLFENALRLHTISDEDREILLTAQKDWLSANKISRSLLTLNNIPSQKVLNNKIDVFSQHLNRSVTLIEELSSVAIDKINNKRFDAQNKEWESIGLMLLIFCLGLLLALLAVISLGQTVIEPIRRLEKSVQKLGQGDTSARAHLKTDNELGNLASAFNVLAERYEHIQSELEYLSVHDSLTGLYDRSKLQSEVSLEMQRAKRYDRSFSLLLIDIDKFRFVNEKYGRLVGDSVLCSVANKICSTVRPTDVAARYGGDEFAVILSETDARGAEETATRLEEAIQNDPLNIGDGKTLSITISISVTTFPNDIESDSILFSLSDNSQLNSKVKKSKHSA